jgi:hypothetical protein
MTIILGKARPCRVEVGVVLAVAAFPAEVRGLAEDAEVAGAAGHLRGVVERVVAAVGERSHARGPFKATVAVDHSTPLLPL